MSKLYFRYGTMNCGKSAALMQVAHNYEENDKKVIVIKSVIDTKGNDSLESRIGLKRKVDILLSPKEELIDYLGKIKESDCILVDEAQFLTESQVEELWCITKELNIPAICYGLRTNFKSELFEESKRLLELSDELEELITICSCGKRAKFNSRFVNNKFTLTGDSVLIDGTDAKVEYRPMCGKCYLENKQKLLTKQH